MYTLGLELLYCAIRIISTSLGISTAPSSNPIAAAWIYMSDDQDYNTIPKKWSGIDFKKVDTLYVGPAGLQADGTFGLYDSNSTGPLANRFQWIIQTARSQNSGIKIIVSQWWGSSPLIWGYDLSQLQNSQAIEKYTDSVQDFLESWLSVSGGVDGYDIDYESGNVVEGAPDILAQIRTNLDALSKDEGGRQFYVTVSPSELEYLDKAVPSLSYVNMQTYAGGSGLSPQDFLDMGLHSQQLLYGICPETGCATPSVEDVETEYTTNKLAGVHTWRLNSDDFQHEQQVQSEIYDFLHSGKKMRIAMMQGL